MAATLGFLKKRWEKSLDKSYKMLRAVLKKPCKKHPTTQHLYDQLPPISQIIQVRRVMETYYFDIVAGVFRGDTLAPYLFIICLDYVFRTSIDKMKDIGFKLTKERSRRYHAQTITDADYADDIVLLANTPTQAETHLHCLERAAAGVGLHVNAHKTEYMSFNQRGDIFTLNGSSLKLADKFTYLGCSISSTETDINTWLLKA